MVIHPGRTYQTGMVVAESVAPLSPWVLSPKWWVTVLVDPDYC